MIHTVLARETCRTCRNCCWYTDDDVWDAPGFTKSELDQAKRLTDNPVYEDRGLFFFRMEKDQGIYTCPLLRETGCLLDSEKPFKCAIWPFYVVRVNESLALAVSSECPSVYQLSNRELIDRLGEVLEQIADRARSMPELIEPCRAHFRIVAELD